MPLLAVLVLVGLGLDTSHVGATEYTKDELKTIAVSIAHAHNLKTDKFLAVIDCESKFNSKAIGALGEVGIVQIYPKYHPTIAREQMLNPVWSMNWMAKQWLLGNAKYWSCWKPDK